MKKLIVLAAFALTMSAQAYWSPIGVSIYEPIELPISTWNVYGIRANIIYGCNNNLAGIDAGCFINDLDGFMYGLQVSPILNIVDGDMGGLQVNPVVNLVRGETFGFQLGGVNIVTHHGYGLQLGFFNRCCRVFHGLQLGLINSAWNMKGVQIGLVNIIQASTLVFCPIINANF